MTRRWIRFGSSARQGILVASLCAGFTLFSAAKALDVPVPQVRTILMPAGGIASPVDGELSYDQNVGQPLLRHLGLWRPLKFAGPGANLIGRLPDYSGDNNGNLAVNPGTVVMLDGESFQNGAPLTLQFPKTQPSGNAVIWKALFAFPSGSGFQVGPSGNFTVPDTLPSGVPAAVVANRQYRYLGSVGIREADGRNIQFTKVENRYFYSEAAVIVKNLSGPVQVSTIANAPASALSISLSLQYFGAGRLTGPHGELFALLPTAQTSPALVNLEVSPALGGAFQLNGPLQNCESDGANQRITGHLEDAALFVN